jgi:hypothetical protein
MSRIKVAAMLILSTGLGAAGVHAFAPQKPADAPAVVPAKAAPVRWRYQVLSYIGVNDLENRMNHAASNGWEVDEVLFSPPTVHTIVFRRPAEGKD